MGRTARAIIAGLGSLLSVLLPLKARAEMCAVSTVSVTVDNVPGHMGGGDVSLLFDGDTAYTTDGNLRLHHPGTIGDNSLILHLGSTQAAGTTYTLYFENTAADGDGAQSYADDLNANGYGAWYWDRDGNGTLDGNDFDVNGDDKIKLGDGDYSALGVVLWLYDGDPGDPVGSGPGTLVHTDYSPVSVIDTVSYSYSGTAPADFDYIVIESIADDAGSDPRIIELELNGVTNTGPVEFSAEACLAVTKTADDSSLSSPTGAGETISYSLQVSNSGTIPTTAVTVSDALGTPVCPSSGSHVIASLAGGGSETCTLTYAVTQADLDGNGGGDGDIDNTVNVSGTSTGGLLTESDSAEVPLTISRSLSVTKTASETTNVAVGEVLTYTYTVTNNGNVTITGIRLADVHNGIGAPPVPGNEALFVDSAPAGDSTDAATDGIWDSLAPGDQIRFTGQYTVTQADVDNLQ